MRCEKRWPKQLGFCLGLAKPRLDGKTLRKRYNQSFLTRRITSVFGLHPRNGRRCGRDVSPDFQACALRLVEAREARVVQAFEPPAHLGCERSVKIKSLETTKINQN